MSKVYREQAKIFLGQGNRNDALRCLKRSITMFPFRVDVIVKGIKVGMTKYAHKGMN